MIPEPECVQCSITTGERPERIDWAHTEYRKASWVDTGEVRYTRKITQAWGCSNGHVWVEHPDTED